MTNTDKILEKINAEATFLQLHKAAFDGVAAKIPGWSGVYHYLFFKSVFGSITQMQHVLIAGVYQGRDIALMSASTKRELNILGVDKFNAEPCDDWPEEKRSMTWQEAFNCEPPSVQKAWDNLTPLLPSNHHLRLVEADDAVFLPSIVGTFDFIFLDTAHDKATVLRQLKQVKPLCHAGTIIAGDDYENLEKTWGVKDAVKESFKEHQVLVDTIWFANAGDLK